MPLQHAGLAAIYGAEFTKDPGQFDPDIARQIERGLAWSGADVAAALVASSAIKDAFAAFSASSTSCWRRPCPASPGRSRNSAQI